MVVEQRGIRKGIGGLPVLLLVTIGSLGLSYCIQGRLDVQVRSHPLQDKRRNRTTSASLLDMQCLVPQRSRERQLRLLG